MGIADGLDAHRGTDVLLECLDHIRLAQIGFPLSQLGPQLGQLTLQLLRFRYGGIPRPGRHQHGQTHHQHHGKPHFLTLVE